MSTIINATTTNGVVIQPDNSGSLVLQTNNGTTALTIDTSQNITTTNKLAVASMPIGSIVQVVYATTTTTFTTTSTTLQDTGFSASITPTSSSNKILVISNNSMYVNVNGQGTSYVYCKASLARGSTQLQNQNLASNTGLTSIQDIASSLDMTCLDSPATTSSVTYKVYIASNNVAFSTSFSSQGNSSLTLIEVKA
jgi:hypothetical protein